MFEVVVRVEQKIPQNKVRLHVEGNIGSGKSTLIRALQNLNNDKIKVFEEPVKSWQNVDGINFLDLVSKNPKQWAFEFQTLAMTTLWENESKSYDKLPIFERSVSSSMKMFAQQQLESGTINSEQFSLLNNMYKMLTKDYTSKPIYFYLYLAPEKAMTRCLERARPEEDSLTLEYFKHLHNVLEKWMSTEENHVFKINADRNPEDILTDVTRLIKLFT